MGDEVHVIAILEPKEGKAKRVGELLAETVKQVYDNEPDCMRYHMLRELEAKPPRIVVVETYKDAAARKKHQETDHYKSLFEQAKSEDLLASQPSVVTGLSAGGFPSREKGIVSGN